MRRLQLAELKDSWSAWLGVSVVFFVTDLVLALCALCLSAGTRLVGSGAVVVEDSTAIVYIPAQNFVLSAVIGAIAIGTATGLVVQSRRGSLARLALAGATPGQVVGIVTLQLAAVSLVCSLVADGFALGLAEPALRLLIADRGGVLADGLPVATLGPLLPANLFAVGIAVLGGLSQARRASRIPPVEALRQSLGDQPRRMGVGRWVGAGIGLIMIITGFVLLPRITAVHTSETVSTVLQGSVVALITTAVVLTLLAPVIVGPLMSAWTRLVPPVDPSWLLTRSAVVAKGARMTKSVVPVMMAIGLLFGLLAVADTLLSSARASGIDIPLDQTGATSFLIILGPPLLVAMAGGVGSLIMMSKQRDAESALSGIVGTTPAQRLAMPIMEAVIITVTGTLLAAVMVAVSITFLALGLTGAGMTFAFDPSYSTFALAFGASLLVTVAATVLPTLASLRRPEPVVIARLVAE